jgi:hypothetical protein
MPTTAPASVAAQPPLRSPYMVVALGWIIPGAGHFLIGRRGRAAIIFGSVALAFAIGALMRGPLFQPSEGGDVLSRLIQYGGFVGDLASGFLYLGARVLGYAPPDSAAHSADYGSKFIVAAGLLNILAMVDAYEITTRLKD